MDCSKVSNQANRSILPNAYIWSLISIKSQGIGAGEARKRSSDVPPSGQIWATERKAPDRIPAESRTKHVSELTRADCAFMRLLGFEMRILYIGDGVCTNRYHYLRSPFCPKSSNSTYVLLGHCQSISQPSIPLSSFLIALTIAFPSSRSSSLWMPNPCWSKNLSSLSWCFLTHFFSLLVYFFSFPLPFAAS